MKVFMLGWEFPPYISGGLGTACYGLTKALALQPGYAEAFKSRGLVYLEQQMPRFRRLFYKLSR